MRKPSIDEVIMSLYEDEKMNDVPLLYLIRIVILLRQKKYL